MPEVLGGSRWVEFRLPDLVCLRAVLRRVQNAAPELLGDGRGRSVVLRVTQRAGRVVAWDATKRQRCSAASEAGNT